MGEWSRWSRRGAGDLGTSVRGLGSAAEMQLALSDAQAAAAVPLSQHPADTPFLQ